MAHVTIDQSKKPRETSVIKRETILSKAYNMALTEGFEKLTRNKMADYIDIPPTSISYYFGSTLKLRDAVMRKAIAGKNLKIIAGGIAVGCRIAKSAPLHLKEEAAKLLYA